MSASGECQNPKINPFTPPNLPYGLLPRQDNHTDPAPSPQPLNSATLLHPLSSLYPSQAHPCAQPLKNKSPPPSHPTKRHLHFIAPEAIPLRVERRFAHLKIGVTILFPLRVYLVRSLFMEYFSKVTLMQRGGRSRGST